MKGLIWNCRGLGSSNKRRHIRELIYEQHIDFLGIQETQLQDFQDSWLEQIEARQDFFWHFLPSNGRSGGLLLGIRSLELTVRLIESGQHCLRAQIQNNNSDIVWDLVVVYGAAQAAGKEAFLREFAHFCSASRNPTCYGGDFNLIGAQMKKAVEENALNGALFSML